MDPIPLSGCVPPAHIVRLGGCVPPARVKTAHDVVVTLLGRLYNIKKLADFAAGAWNVDGSPFRLSHRVREYNNQPDDAGFEVLPSDLAAVSECCCNSCGTVARRLENQQVISLLFLRFRSKSRNVVKLLHLQFLWSDQNLIVIKSIFSVVFVFWSWSDK
jgi:hypothetical protein